MSLIVCILELINNFPPKLPRRCTIQSAVLLQPSGRVRGCAPYMVLVSILVTVHVTDNDVLVAELLFTWAAFLIVQLDLKVLVAVKVHVVVDDVSPERIIGISLLDLVRPPWHLLWDLRLTSHQFIEVLVHEMIEMVLNSAALLLLLFAFLLLLGHYDLT